MQMDDQDFDNVFATAGRGILRLFSWALYLIPLMLAAAYIESCAFSKGMDAIGKAFPQLESHSCGTIERHENKC